MFSFFFEEKHENYPILASFPVDRVLRRRDARIERKKAHFESIKVEEMYPQEEVSQEKDILVQKMLKIIENRMVKEMIQDAVTIQVTCCDLDNINSKHKPDNSAERSLVSLWFKRQLIKSSSKTRTK